MSDIKLYDDAVVNKFKKVFKNSIYGFSDLAFKIKSQESKVTFPLISIFRLPYETKHNAYNAYMKARGRYVTHSEDKTEITYLKNIELQNFKYQIDVWSEDQETNSRLLQELVWFIKDNPELIITLETVKQEIKFFIDFNANEIIDNTDLNTFTENGRIYRQTFEISIRNPQTFNIHAVKSVLDIDVSLTLQNREGQVESQEIIAQ